MSKRRGVIINLDELGPPPARSRAERRAAEGKTWYHIENKAATAEPARVYLYDEIGMWGIGADDFVRELGEVKASSITLHVNSPGGEVYDGFAIFNAIRNHPAHVTARIDGLAASAASFIAQAADKIVIESTGEMMIHDAAGLCWGNAADMTSMASTLDRMSDTIAGIYAERTETSREGWRTCMQAETWYNAAEAVAAGLADETAPAPKRKTDPDAPGAEQEEGSEDAEDAGTMPKPKAPPKPKMPKQAEADRVQAEWLDQFKFAGRACAPDPDLAPDAHESADQQVDTLVSILPATLFNSDHAENPLAALLEAAR